MVQLTPHETEALAASQLKSSEADIGAQERVTIRLPLIPGADRQLEIGVNGVFIRVERGKDVRVPMAFKEALDHADDAGLKYIQMEDAYAEKA